MHVKWRYSNNLCDPKKISEAQLVNLLHMQLYINEDTEASTSSVMLFLLLLVLFSLEIDSLWH